MTLLTIWRSLAVGGLLGLIFLIILWNGWLTPVQQMPRWMELLILLSPLMLLVRGILHGWVSTHVKAVLVSLIYTTIGLWYASSQQEKPYGYLLLLFSVCLYLGGFMTAKVLGKKAK
jgi:uncharacterized membrane protein